MGPVEFLVLAFPGEEIGADVLAPLAALGRSGGVRLIDSLVVTKAADGSIGAAELVDFDHLEDVVSDADAAKLMGAEDAEEAAALIGPGSSALLLLVEHVWATEATEAFRNAGGRVAASVRIPPEHITEARHALANAQQR